MTKRWLLVVSVGAALILSAAAVVVFHWAPFLGHGTPEGRWVQIDTKTYQPQNVIEIYSQDDRLFGKVVERFQNSTGQPLPETCDFCVGEAKNAPIMGLVILRNIKPIKDHAWGHGTILDLYSGREYRCQLTLLNDGHYMKVHGYLGLPLFGWTQVWIRKD